MQDLDSQPPPYIVPHSKSPIAVLYADDDILIVNKPHLLLSVPGRHPLNRDSLIGRLAGRYPGVTAVHRLDLDTSGILIVPRNRNALAEMGRAFQARAVKKTYHAIVWGSPATTTGEIDLPIARDWHNRPKQKICAASGKPALTRWQIMARRDNRCLLALEPVTGRSHQLRIHLRELGHPILGCDMYAHAKALAAAPRLLLHASRIGFYHPRTQEWVEAVCPAPFDLDNF